MFTAAADPFLSRRPARKECQSRSAAFRGWHFLARENSQSEVAIVSKSTLIGAKNQECGTCQPVSVDENWVGRQVRWRIWHRPLPVPDASRAAHPRR
jgi:hypothetical protein